jgi:hypothetical protein
VALLVVPVPDAGRLAAACALVRVDATVVPLEGAGSAVVLDDPQTGEDAGQRLSRVLGQADVVLLTRREGQVTARGWRAGAITEAQAPGLVLFHLPDLAEKLLMGAPAGEQPGAVSSRGMSRMSAARAAVSGSPAEAAWTARVQRWDRVATLVVLVLVAGFAILEGTRLSAGDGSALALALAVAVSLLLGVRALRQRRAP